MAAEWKAIDKLHGYFGAWQIARTWNVPTGQQPSEWTQKSPLIRGQFYCRESRGETLAGAGEQRGDRNYQVATV
jgi:hypothetical protein